MKTFTELNVTNSTIFDWEGKELRTTQDPYIDNMHYGDYRDDDMKYTAIVVDENDNEYRAYWVVINHDTDDESDRCDWDNPIRVEKL